MMNHVKTMFLMVLLTLVLIVLGGLIAGDVGVIVAFSIAMVLNFFAYWHSDRLAITMTRSRPLPEREAPEVYRAMRELTENNNMPMPRLYLMPTEQPNAFASGRNDKKAVIAVTQGLMNMLNYDELKGVLAHELAHIRNRDILVNTIAAVMAGALMFISRMGMWGMMFGGGRRSEGGGHPALLIIKLAALILAPIAAMLIRMAISRTREYHADSTGAYLAGDNRGLASALQKMDQFARRARPPQGPATVNEATSHMFIVNPLFGGMGKLFSTHPPIEERVDRLLSR